MTRGLQEPACVTARAERPGTHRLTGRDGDRTYAGTVESPTLLTPIPVDGDWTLTLAADGAGTGDPPPRQLERPRAPPLRQRHLHQDIDLDARRARGRRLVLDLGTVRGSPTSPSTARSSAPPSGPAYTVDVTDGLKPGANRIAVRVSNTLSNERKRTPALRTARPGRLRTVGPSASTSRPSAPDPGGPPP
ncbi:hypothetical protein [Streptomyces sp. KL116D]|uniref:hypothetical protein n=1 Tax=Streptomyces sp. KL116D TaxID=3045152 RepID=UPI003555FDA1